MHSRKEMEIGGALEDDSLPGRNTVYFGQPAIFDEHSAFIFKVET
jgi:hypothetical protein